MKSLLLTALILTTPVFVLAQSAPAPIVEADIQSDAWRGLKWQQPKTEVINSLRSQGLKLTEVSKKTQDFNTTVKIDDVEIASTKFDVRLAFAEDNTDNQLGWKLGLIGIIMKTEKTAYQKKYKRLSDALSVKYGSPIASNKKVVYGLFFWDTQNINGDSVWQTPSTVISLKQEIPKFGVYKIYMNYFPNIPSNDI